MIEKTQYHPVSVTFLVSNPSNDAESICRSFRTSRISGRREIKLDHARGYVVVMEETLHWEGWLMSVHVAM